MTVIEKEDLDTFAKHEIDTLSRLHESSPRAVVLGLSGELGAGKTTFTQALARALGVEDEVVSPTFIIARYYDIPHHERFKLLVHVDAYRIEHEEELRAIRWDQAVLDPQTLIIVEWPEKLGQHAADVDRIIRMTHLDETKRAIDVMNEVTRT